MRTNYVLIDFENVQPETLESLTGDSFRVVIFVGTNQRKVSIELATSVQRLGERAEYVQISGAGKNALDFHIAYHLGVLSEKEPNAYFHIVSKDTGFEPLIDSLKKKEFGVSRVSCINEISVVAFSKKLVKLSDSDRALSYIEKLEKNGASRPKSLKTLRSSLVGHFLHLLSPGDIEKIIAELKKRKFIAVSGEKVSYPGMDKAKV